MSETAMGPLALTAIGEFEEAHADLDPEAVGRALVDDLPEGELRRYAIAHVTDWVTTLRRAKARAVEKTAALADAQKDSATREARFHEDREGRLQQLFDDPTLYAGNGKRRREFRQWAGDRFGEWYERGRAAAAASGEKQLHFFQADWHDGGTREYYEILRSKRMRELINEVAEETRLETTRELLATVFAVGDGSQVTWGAATSEQHERRIEMLAGNASGVIETAARHVAAVRMIREAGVACLAEIGTGPAIPAA